MTNRGDEKQPGEAHYQLAMEATDVGLWDWDLVQNKQIWNAQCRAIFGLHPDDEASYERFLSLLHPDDRDSFAHLVTNALNNKARLDLEYRIIRGDGSVRWIGSRGRGIYNSAGELVRLIGLIFDVTARKELEERRTQSDRRVRAFLERVDEAFIHLDRAWCITYVNWKTEVPDIQVPAEELIGQNFWDMYPVLTQTTTFLYFCQVMETRQPVAYEIYYPRTQSWYDIRVYPADDGGIIIFSSNSTRRKTLEQERAQLLAQEHAARVEAEHARQQSEELMIVLNHRQAFLKAIMQQTPIGLMIAEAPRGNILFYSEETPRMLDHEIVTTSIGYEGHARKHKALHADKTPYRAEEYPLTRALLTGEVVMQEDILYQHEDGRQIHLSVNSAPIRDPQGNILAAVIAFNDTSERYELERKKDEFIVMASHELRTPLTSIKGNLQLIQRQLQHLLGSSDSTLDGIGKATVERLAQWNERALRQLNVECRLVNDLLDASLIQTRALRVSLEPDNLLQVVREVVDDMRVVAHTRPIYLNLPSLDEVPVMIDRVRIMQVLTNYLMNAITYSEKDQPVAVEVSFTENEAHVHIRDTGPGIGAEALDEIWDRFHRLGSFVDYNRLLGGGGLGLGLYINYALIQQHGGRCGARSTIGRGSDFWFTLPLAI